MMKNTTIILLHFGLPQFFWLCLKNGISSDKNVYESTGRSEFFGSRWSWIAVHRPLWCSICGDRRRSINQSENDRIYLRGPNKPLYWKAVGEYKRPPRLKKISPRRTQTYNASFTRKYFAAISFSPISSAVNFNISKPAGCSTHCRFQEGRQVLRPPSSYSSLLQFLGYVLAHHFLAQLHEQKKVWIICKFCPQ